MGRYSARTNGKTPKAQLNISPIEFEKIGARTPASADTESTNYKMEEMPNKRAYFVALLNQYYGLSQFFSDKKELNSCPNFHNVWLNLKKPQEYITYKPRFTLSDLKSDATYSKNPILLLPVDSTAKTSYDLYKDGFIKTEADLYKNLNLALLYKVSQIHLEVTELCEYGSSDDYFIYENFITYSKDKNDDKMEKRLGLALRNNILINQALISSMDIPKKTANRTIASESIKKDDDLKTILSKFNMPWAETYFMGLENK